MLVSLALGCALRRTLLGAGLFLLCLLGTAELRELSSVLAGTVSTHGRAAAWVGGWVVSNLLAAIRERAQDPARYRDSGAELRRPARAILDEAGVQPVERELGVRLPELLRAVYIGIGDGGFGPGYGLLPLSPLNAEPDQDSVLGLYRVFSGADPEEPSWVWPRQLVLFCDWGCAIRSCVDCSTDAGAVVTFDPNTHREGEDWSDSFASTHAGLEAWFSDWVAGVRIWDLMFEPDPSRARAGVNPFTRQPMTFVPRRIRR